jgi:hypothetical protein
MTDQIKVRFADRMDLDGCIALDHRICRRRSSNAK